MAASPRPPEGWPDRPASALTLRMVLAVFGLIVCGGFAVLAALTHHPVGAILLAVLAVTAVVDIVVIQRRQRQRRARGGLH